MEFFAEMATGSNTASINISDHADKTVSGAKSDTLAKNPLLGNLITGALSKIALPPAVSDPAHPLTLYFDNNSMEDLWMAITWGNERDTMNTCSCL